MILAALLALSSPVAATRCTLADALPVSVREMAHTPDRWLGRCVRAEGYAVGNMFYADVAGAYAENSTIRRDRPNDGWLGLYGPAVVPRSTLRRGTIWGVVHDCGRDYDQEAARAEPNTLLMAIGFCHYQPGLVLLPSWFRVAGPARFERQVGDAARARFGDLIPASADHPVPADVVALVERFLASLRAGDRTALGALVSPWSETFDSHPEAEQDFRAYLAGEGVSPFAILKHAATEPQRAYFRERQNQDDLEFAYAETWHACFCLGPDCAGRWPIAGFDATAIAGRPYLCLRAFNGQSLSARPDRLAIERRDSGLSEPDGSR